MLLHFCFFWTALTSQAQLTGPEMDPRIHWQTISTQHFEIHFDSQTELQAQKLAGISENVWTRITQKFNWEPSYPVHIVLSDSTDEPNGMAVPLPYNHIYLYAVPPTDSSALDYYDDWITTLLTHEFTHTTHIDMARGLNKIPRAVLGRSWLPNAAQQQWAIEGLAEYNETYETTKGRGRSPFISMFLRTVSQENEFASIDKATYWYHHYPYGNTAYWYGIGFHNYLREKFGDSSIFDFANENASNLIPSFFNFKTKKIFGKSFSRLWSEWKNEEKIKADQIATTYQTQIKTEALAPSMTLVGRPAWSEDGKTLYTSLSEHEDSKIYAWTQSADQKWNSEIVLKSKGPGRLSVIQDHLVYSELSSTSPWTSYYDLFAYNLKTKKTKRLTRDLRLRDPFAYKDYIVGVRIEGFQASIVRIPLDLNENKIPSESPYPIRWEVLFKAPGQSSISKPKISPDGHFMTFSMRLEGGERDLYLFDLRTNHLESLTQDIADDSDPEFSSDSQSIYFSSYRNLGSSNIPVMNIFQIDLTSLQISQITDTWTGMGTPSVFGTHMALGHFHSNGWSLEILENPHPLFADVGHGERKDFSPPTEKPSWNFEKKDYDVGKTLLPRFIVPVVLYTESDTLTALFTGSRDPLSFHTWTGLGYYLSNPQRPGGALSYIYKGLPWFSIFGGAAAGITNYGQVLYTKASASSPYVQAPSDYYERNYRAYVGISYGLWMGDEEPKFSIDHSLFFDNRSPLLKSPVDLARGVGDINFSSFGKGTISNVQLSPDRGNQWGLSSSLTWSDKIKQDTNSISPKEGSLASAVVEFSPKTMASDFEQLTTLLTAKTYHGFSHSHFVAARGALDGRRSLPLCRTTHLGSSTPRRSQSTSPTSSTKSPLDRSWCSGA
jgi:Tol biopolymer transport system component